MNGLVMTLVEDEIFVRLAALSCEQFLPISGEWRCQGFNEVVLHGNHFFSQCIQQHWSVRQKCFIRSKLPTIACWSREEREEGAKTTCFMSKKTLVPQANHSQHSSPVEALNLTVESKSLPVESNNSTIELHLPIEAKESSQWYCSVYFDFLNALIPLDMTFDDTLSDGSSFGKLTTSWSLFDRSSNFNQSARDSQTVLGVH